jgi:hypothetical protein
MVREDAFTVSIAPVDEHALMLGEVVPVTETVAPTVSRDESVVFEL